MLFTYIVYNSVLLFTVIFCILIEKSRNRISEYGFRTLLFLSLALPACLRKGIGTDYWNYVILYRRYRDYADDHELGFQWLAKICLFLDAHYQYFIIILTILAIAPICYYIPKKNCSFFIITYFVLLYLDIIGTSRQDVSVAFIVCGIIALYHNRGNLKYLFTGIIGFLFHYSSVMYFPLILFKRIRLSYKMILILLGLTLCLTAGMGMIEWILNNPMFIDSPYGAYLGNTQYITEAKVGSGMGILVNILIPILFIVLYPRSSKHIEHSGFYGILAIIFIGSYLLASKVHIFGRLVNVFIFVPAFLAYPTSKAISQKNHVLVFIGFMLLYMILLEKAIAINPISLGSGLGVSPYTSIFD